jgi:hypothetical protein
VVGEHLTGDKRILSEGVVLKGAGGTRTIRRNSRSWRSRMSVERNLKKLGLTLPSIPTPVANYVPWKRDGNTIYLSGRGRATRTATQSGKSERT